MRTHNYHLARLRILWYIQVHVSRPIFCKAESLRIPHHLNAAKHAASYLIDNPQKEYKQPEFVLSDN